MQKFPDSDRKWQVSVGKIAAFPRWSLDGQELYFDIGGILAAVNVSGLEGSEFTPSVPRPLFSGLQALPHNFDVTRAGRRFLVLLTQGTTTGVAEPITVVLNWKSGLSQARW